jgi:TetR/AcrR family transcriptional regulator, cholesterol catabolism regulator
LFDPSQTQNDAPPVGRRERKKLEARRHILAAALELFREKGYDTATVEEIAERADVAKGTFFNHFPRKDSLLEALAEDVVVELFEDLGPVEGWEGTARDQVLRLYLRIGELVARDPELSKVMIIENLRNFWLRTEADCLEKEFQELLHHVLLRGQAAGELAPEADVAMGARLVEAAYVTTMVEWLRDAAPEAQYREQLIAKFDIVFRGLGMPGPAVKGSGG